MLTRLPALLKCLQCGQEGLKLGPGSILSHPNGLETVLRGAVICPKCRTSYPIQDGILNFLIHRQPKKTPVQLSDQFYPTAWGYERFWRKRALKMLGAEKFPPAVELATLVRMLNCGFDRTSETKTAFYLDLGCSTCFYSRGIVTAHRENRLISGATQAHAVAVDNSRAMLKEARGFIRRDGLDGQVSLVRADAEQLPFIDSAFLGVACGASLNEFQHSEVALAETRRTLEAGGNTVFMVQMAAEGKTGQRINWLINKTSGVIFFKPDRLLQLFREAGLKLVEQQTDGLITINHLRRD